MSTSMKIVTALGVVSLLGLSHAQSCLSPSAGIRPSVASGYALQVVATGLSRPRGLSFDSQGHLLVVEAGSGILSSHIVNDSGNCTRLQNSTTVIQGSELNHGLWVNGTTLFVVCVYGLSPGLTRNFPIRTSSNFGGEVSKLRQYKPG